MTTYPTGETAQLADQAADSADAAIRTARTKAHDALDGLSDTMQNVKDQASAAFDRLRPQLDSVTAYAKDEPTKALLISAAAGAAVMGLIALTMRSSGGVQVPSARELRKGTDDPADRWRSAAADAAEGWRKTAAGTASDWRQKTADAADEVTDRTDGAIESARTAARSVYDGVNEKVQQWREQAAPMVDRIRPQLDAVTGYAKEDPVKALMIGIAAAAALMGIVSSINRR